MRYGDTRSRFRLRGLARARAAVRERIRGAGTNPGEKAFTGGRGPQNKTGLDES